MQTKRKFVALTIAFAMAFAVATPAGAVTIAELQAQINALMAQLAALQGGSANTSYTFTQNLTVGSTGADVTSLQQFLVGGGYLNMPAGVSYGYFGPLTRAAVAAWQAANGVAPAVGYWGPISRAAANAAAPSTPGAATPGSTAGITTPGVEGTITVTRYPAPASGTKVYEGDSKRDVLGIEVEAKTSDMRVERIKLDLDETGDTATADSAFYNKFAQKIYIMDGSTILASADLNSSTVVEESNEISITLAGMSVVVPKGTKKVFTVALDAKDSWDSTYDNDTWTITVPADGIRSIDGAGVNQYGPTAALTAQSVTSAAQLLDSATLAISTNSATPDTQDVVCISGSDEDECDELEVLRFDVRAEKDTVTITDLNVDINMGGADGSDAVTAYLYDSNGVLVGSDAIDDALDGTDDAVFADIDYVVPKDTTKTLTVKIDVTDTDLTRDTFTADVDTADVTSENSLGDGVTESGSATGQAIGVRKVGPVITMLSKSIATNGVPQGSTGDSTSTSTLTATFAVRIKAVGGALTLGTVASTTAPLFGTDVANDGFNSFELLENGAASDANTATSSSFTISTSDTTAATGANGRVLAENQSTDVTVTYQVLGRAATSAVLTSAIYAVQFEGIQWFNATTGTAQTTTFMGSDADWRTSDVSFP